MYEWILLGVLLGVVLCVVLIKVRRGCSWSAAMVAASGGGGPGPEEGTGGKP
jgi:hypothetical protein